MHSCPMDVSRCRTRDCSTHIAGEGMKEDAVLIILEVSINLVFPKFTTGAYEVNEA